MKTRDRNGTTPSARTARRFNLRQLGKGVLGLLSRAEVTATVSALSLAAAPGIALAGPEGEQTVRGNVSFERRGGEMIIRASNGSIINYRSFNIAGNESVRFIQPDAASRVLNRITSAAPTRIDGALTANGRVYIVNPAGVYFGQNAVVDVNALYAAAGSMTDSDFSRGIDRFTNLHGGVFNEGTLRGNAIGLVGQQVGNFGRIVAPQGTVVLAAGQDIIVGQRDGNIVVRVPRAAESGSTTVVNTGEINASGGRVAMVAGDLLGAAMFNSGRIAGGDVRIEAQAAAQGTSRATVSGEIDGSSSTGQGGTIRVLAERVQLEGATIDASGTTGGRVLIGGDFYGRGPEQRAINTSVDERSILRADGTAGDAGQVVVWADGTTRFDGTILARATGATGSGGIAEVSGKQHIAISGHALLSGVTESGFFTIDPGTVTIVDGPNAGPGGALDTFNDAWIIDQMNTGGATLLITTANSTNGGAENLTVDAAADISYNSNQLLNLHGGNAVTVNGTITNAGGGGLALTGGAITVNGALNIGGSVVTQGTTFTNNAAITSGRHIQLDQTGAVNVNANLTAGLSFASNNTGIGGTFDSSGFAIDANDGNATISHAGDAVTIGNIESSAAIAVVGANVTQAGSATSATYGVTATGLLTISDDVTVTGAGGFLSSSAGFTSGAAGTITASNTAGEIDIDAATGNIAIGADLVSGTGGIELTAGAGTIAQNGAAITTGGYNASSSGQYTLGDDISAATATIASGTSGTGNLVFGAFTIDADAISLRAGSGSGTSAIIDLSANPLFGNTAGTARPTSFTFRQDATIADAGVPAAARFRGATVAGMNYTLRSDGGSVTVATGAKVSGSALTLVGATGVTISTDLALASLDVTGATTLSADLTAGTGAINFRDAVALGASNRTITGGAVTFAEGATSTGGGLQIANSGTLTVGDTIALTGGGAFNQSGSGGVALGASVTTQNQNITFAGAIGLTGDAALSAGTGTVDVNNTVDLSNLTLTLSGDEIDLAGAGSVTGTGGAIILQPSASGVSIGVGSGSGTLSISAADIAALGTGISSITIGRAGGNHAIDIGASTFNSATTFRAGSGGSIAVNGLLTGQGNASFALQGPTTLNDDIITDGRIISITGPITLGTGQSEYRLDTTSFNSSTGANITLGDVDGESAGTRTLNLIAGSAGDITVGDVGQTNRLDVFRILSVDDATIGDVHADAVAQTSGVGITTFGDILAEDAVTLTSVGFNLQDVEVNGGFGLVMNNSGASTIAGDLNLEGQFLQSGTGGVSLGGDVTTTFDNVSFGGAVTLTADSAINTAGGNVVFASTIDGGNDLAINTGGGDTTFVGDIGSTTAVGIVDVTTDAATFNGSVVAGTLDVSATGDIVLNDDIAAATLSLAGGTDGVGNLTFAAGGITLAGDDITLAVGDSAAGGTATLNLGSNTPTFAGGTGGATSPDSLTLIQDASFSETDLPEGDAFGSGIDGMDYTITSRDGEVVIAGGDRVAGTNLTVNGGEGVRILDDLELASFTTSSDIELTGRIVSDADIVLNSTLTLVGGPGGLNAGAGSITLADVNAGANDLALTADSIVLNGILTGSNTLLMQPGTASRNIRLGGVGGTSGVFELSTAELANIADGWGRIIIGRTDGDGLLLLASDVTFNDPAVLRMSGALGRMDILNELQGRGDASLRLFSGNDIVLYDNVNTQGGLIELSGDVRLRTSAVVDSTNGGADAEGADISIRGVVSSAQAGQHAFTVNAGTAGSARIEGNIGGDGILDALTIDALGIDVGPVTTEGAQDYDGTTYLRGDLTSTITGAITLGGNVFLEGDADIITSGGVGADIDIAGGVNSGSTGPERTLNLNAGAGSISIGDHSGASRALNAFGASAAAIETFGIRANSFVEFSGPTTLFGAIRGSGVIFNNDLVLARDVSIVGTSNVTFDGLVDSQPVEGNDLIIVSPVTTFVREVGSATQGELGTLSTTGGANFSGQSVETLDAQSYGGNVQLNEDLTFTSGAGGVEFLGGIIAATAGRSLIINTSGETLLAGSIGTTATPLASMTTSGGGLIRVAAPTIRTTNSQDYASAVVVEGDTSFISSLGDTISFASTINSGANGARAVSVSSSGGGVTFGGAIGGDNPLSQFSVTATSFTVPSVRTTGSQTYTGITTLTGDLTATGAGDITISGVARLASSVTVTTAGGADDDVSFAGAVNAQDTSRDLSVNAGLGDVTFGSDIGTGTGAGERAIANLSVSGAGVRVRNVQTTGSQAYSGTTTVGSTLASTGTGAISFSGPTLLSTNLTVTTASGDIIFGGTINSDGAARTLSVVGSANAVKRFDGSIGNTAPLSTISVNDGATRIGGDLVATTGNQTWSGPITLTNNVRFRSPTSTTFVSTIDSDRVSTPRSLVVDFASGAATTANATFSGNLGGTLRLNSVQTVGNGSARVGGNITTARGVDFFGPFKLLASSTVDGGTGVLLFRSTIDTDVNLSPANLTLLSARSEIGPDRAPFRFGGNIGASNAIANLTIGTDNPAGYGAASIVFSDSFDTEGRVLSSGVAASDLFTISTSGNFTMGAGHKLTSFGRLRINAGGTATLGDLVSIADITVTSNNIRLRARQPRAIFDNTFEDPDQFPMDTGTDIVAGSVTFSSVPTVIGSGNTPTFATNTGDVPANLGGFAFRRFTGGVRTGLFTDTRTGGSNFLLPLDLRAVGASSAQLATSLAGALPRDVTPGEVVTPMPISTSMQSSLAEMGIQTRNLSAEETIDYLVGNATYDDVRPRAGLVADDYRIAANRLTGPAASRAIESYRELVFTQEVDASGNPVLDASGEPVVRDRTPQIKATLARAWEGYAIKAQNPSGVGFRAYLENRGAEASTTEVQALQDLNATRATLTSIRAIGLSEYEASIPRRKIMDKIRPDSISDTQLLEAIFGAPVDA